MSNQSSNATVPKEPNQKNNEDFIHQNDKSLQERKEISNNITISRNITKPPSEPKPINQTLDKERKN